MSDKEELLDLVTIANLEDMHPEKEEYIKKLINRFEIRLEEEKSEEEWNWEKKMGMYLKLKRALSWVYPYDEPFEGEDRVTVKKYNAILGGDF